MSVDPGVTSRLLTVPNVLSIVRLLLLPVFVVLLLTDRLLWAAAVLAVASLTDYLDGKIARGYGLESRFGQLLDPIADRLYIATTLLGLAWVGALPWWLLVVLVARDAFILSMAPLVTRLRLPIPPVDFVGKAATFCLLGAFPLLLVGAVDGWWTAASLVVGWALTWWGTVLYWVTGLIYAWQVRDMLRQRRTTTAVR
ncbi:CDP-alcohol phosphatidyltransferase family protein [Ornithinimicrobium cerasi]|uniref:Cardiolipin synthase n=1 Tax=Ornithinimicrobium cerasi TaxID=2248773 RepID=A0A285VNZ8_9MICO|nr:CDP-alcohol phosphatidyltransferase family protein [Ornithinimicrobium cerasi]SOC54331.1 cardiolipin synthase [Ornithinimicrobium cerasi]